MKRFGLTLLIFTLTSVFCTLKSQEQKSYDLATIAFYNLENLFDTIVDLDTNKILQDEFTPKGKNAWTGEHYKKKLVDMSGVIADIGTDVSKTAPMIVGISEVENKSVVVDLINTEPLKSFNYCVVHYESNDRRGIDVALIYRKDFVKILSSESKRVSYPEEEDYRTRDQLVVEADIQGESVYVIVNHWPSRRGGEKKSSPKREATAKLCRSIIDSLTTLNANAKVVVMGDLNDNPTDKSVKEVLNTSGDKANIADGQLYNPMEKKYKKGNGSNAWKDTWSLFDQLIVSKSLVASNTDSWKFYTAKIYKKPELIQQTGRYKDYPKRTYSFGTWVGGYSDHFPVYLYLIREKK